MVRYGKAAVPLPTASIPFKETYTVSYGGGKVAGAIVGFSVPISTAALTGVAMLIELAIRLSASIRLSNFVFIVLRFLLFILVMYPLAYRALTNEP
jgi:hypothetical protein